MPKITIYTTPFCPYCQMAKQLLTRKGAEFDEIDVHRNPAIRAQMQAESGRNTVPQIWIGGRHVGGCDDLYELDAAGGLEPLLTT